MSSTNTPRDPHDPKDPKHKPLSKEKKVPDHISHDPSSPKEYVDVRDPQKPGVDKKPTETK